MRSAATTLAPAPSSGAGAGCPFSARLAALSTRLHTLDRGPASHLQPLSAAQQLWYDTISREHEQQQELNEVQRREQLRDQAQEYRRES